MNDNDDDVAYLLARANQEDKAARNAKTALAATLHRSLADRYRILARDPDADLKLSIVRD